MSPPTDRAPSCPRQSAYDFLRTLPHFREDLIERKNLLQDQVQVDPIIILWLRTNVLHVDVFALGHSFLP